MSFVSYAQNFEDVMLWRALGNIENGFYIDIGAQDPVVDSVSFAFYKRGWRGIHVEPTEQYSDKLRIARPDETVEQVAIGNFSDKLDFFEFSGTGLSTADNNVAEVHHASGFSSVKREVKVLPLDDLLDRCEKKEVHWLKIDVEGLEKSVIDSWSSSKVRPWILIIESTRPLTTSQAHYEWEVSILNKGYHFCYFDGLNRFYVHESHNDLREFFKCPPNVFDCFMLSGTASQPFCRLVKEEAEEKIKQYNIKAQEAEVTARQAEDKVEKLENELQMVYLSKSWRITQPLRAFQAIYAKLLDKIPGN